MSEENVTALKNGFAQFERDGIPFFELFDPDIELINFDSFPVTRPYYGLEGIVQWLADVSEPFQDFRMELVDVIAHDAEQVVTACRVTGVSRSGGPPFELVWGVIWTFSDGKIVRSQGFRAPEEALDAAGLSEWAMSQENVEIVRRGIEALNRGDVDAWLETMDPEIGWDISTYPLPDVPPKGRGRKAVVEQFFGTYLSGWTDYESELTEVIDAGDQVVAVVHETARMRETDVLLDRDLIYLSTIRDGRTTFVRVFRTKEEALEAAGLSE